jgi:uncharacterized protein YceH (UPF0502 family)
MAVDERRRHQLFEGLVTAVGEDAAVTMFELLPPPSADLATRADLDRLEQRIDGLEQRIDGLEQRIDGLEQRIDALAGRFDAFDGRLDERSAALRDELTAVFRGELVTAVAGQTRAMLVAVVTTVAAVGGLSLALAQLLT